MVPKNTIWSINSSNNKLNSKIILIFYSYPNAFLVYVCLGFDLRLCCRANVPEISR